MMTEPVQEMGQVFVEREALGSLDIRYCGEYRDRYGSIFINVAYPKDEFAGSICLPFFYDLPSEEVQKRYKADPEGYSALMKVAVERERWLRQSSYSGMEFTRIDEADRRKIYEFIKLGLPAILAVKAANENMDIEEVKQKLPKKKAVIVGLGADFSGRGKTMLATIVAHLRKDIGVVSGEVFSGNNVTKYGKAIEGMDKDPRFFDFERAVEQMKEVSRTDEKLEGGTVRTVVDRIWEAWFENKDKDILLVDLPGRSEEADYPANSFGLLRFAMATFDVQRLDLDEGGQISATVAIKGDVIRDDWQHFLLKIDGVKADQRMLEEIFEAAVEDKWPEDMPLPKSFKK